MRDARIAFLNPHVITTKNSGTRDTHARNENPGYGKERFIKRAEKRERYIQSVLLSNLKFLKSIFCEVPGVLIVVFIKSCGFRA